MKSPLDNNAGPSFLAKMPRSARLSIGVVLCLVVLFLLGLGLHASVNSLYHNNKTFVLNKTEIPTDSDYLKQEVRTACAFVGIHEFKSLLPDLPLKALREELLKNSRIEDVKIRRFYPDTLRIEIVPRIPVAILHFPPNSGKADLLIDQDGMVLPRNVAANTSSLPSVIGIKNLNAFREGERTNDRGILAFLAFLRESSLRPEGSEYEILNVKLDEKNERMTLILKASGVFKSGAQIVMPLDNISSEMNRVQMIVELRRNANETISYLNATYQNIPVRP